MPVNDKENLFLTSKDDQESAFNKKRLVDFNPNVEPLLRENPNRFVVFPIEYPNIWSMYKQSEATFWTTEEIDVTKDTKDWIKLTDNEHKFILNVLAGLGVSVRLLEDLVEDLSRDIKVTEAICFFGLQIAVESIHSEMYTLIIDTYIKNAKMKEDFFGSVGKLAFVDEKVKWATQWLSDSNKATFSERIVALAAMESILFSSSFAMMFWLKKRGILYGMTTANDHIVRDEEAHRDFACLMFTYIVQKPSQAVICQIIKSAVAIEQTFVSSTFPDDLIDCKFMHQYVEYVADKLLSNLGCAKMYNSHNPFEFISNSSAAIKDGTSMNVNIKEDFNIVDDFSTNADF